MRVKGCQIHRYVAFKAALALSFTQNQTSGGELRIESKINNQRIEQSWTNTKIDTIYYLANGIVTYIFYDQKTIKYVHFYKTCTNWQNKFHQCSLGGQISIMADKERLHVLANEKSRSSN